MNPDLQQQWRERILEAFAEAVGNDRTLRDAMVFKGARVLALHISGHRRASLDLDAAMAAGTSWTQDSLKAAIRSALERSFISHDPRRYVLKAVKVEPRPRHPHPRGWDGWLVTIQAAEPGSLVRNYPNVTVDLAAAEPLRDGALCDMRVGSSTIRAYSLVRVLGEKGRAFLQSIAPGSPRPRRVKDLYDLALVWREHPLELHQDLWREAALHFADACASKDVVFRGIATFADGLDNTRRAYEGDSTLSDIAFEDAWPAIEAIIALWTDILAQTPSDPRTEPPTA